MSAFSKRIPAKTLCVLASILLLLGTASVSLSLPAPPVTDYALPVSGPAVKIIGSNADVAVACTSDSTTTARILREGYPLASVHVPNGSSITTITWYGTNNVTLAGVAGYDQDHVAVTQTVAADQICEVPSAIGAYKYILPVTNAAGTLYFHFER